MKVFRNKWINILDNLKIVRGLNAQASNNSIPSVIGMHGEEHINENGEIIKELQHLICF